MKKYIQVKIVPNGDVFLKHEFLGNIVENEDFAKLLIDSSDVVQGSVYSLLNDITDRQINFLAVNILVPMVLFFFLLTAILLK